MDGTVEWQFLLQRLLVQLMIEDGLDAPVGAGAKVKSAAAGGFQMGIWCAAQKSTRFLRLVVVNGSCGGREATAIACARR